MAEPGSSDEDGVSMYPDPAATNGHPDYSVGLRLPIGSTNGAAASTASSGSSVRPFLDVEKSRPVAAAEEVEGPQPILERVDSPNSTTTHENGSNCRSSPSSTTRSLSSSDAAGARFWRPAVGRLFDVYLERRLEDVLHILLHLDVLHWRQLLEFYYAVRAFLKNAPSDQLMPPPPLPADVFVYIATAYLTGRSEPPLVSELIEPMWYIEAMALLRLLMSGGASSKGECENHGLPVPPLVVQFVVHMLSSSAASQFIFTAGLQGHEIAWALHGGDMLLAAQHVILRLYPDDSDAGLPEGPRMPLLLHEVPPFLELVASTALQFSSHLMIGASSSGEGWGKDATSNGSDASAPPHSPVSRSVSGSIGAELPEARHLSPSPFPVVMRCLGLLSRASVATKRVGDRFLLCVGDVLHQLLGPAAKNSTDLPEPVPSSPVGREACGRPLDTKDFGRMIRTIVRALFADPARLAAREAERRQAKQNGTSASQHAASSVDAFSAGSFAGPIEQGDFVPVLEQGPLRRNLAFMEQSALLHVVQSKLCATQFADVVGETDQLSHFALRNANVLWFDLRRCTSTLKQSDAGAPDTAGETSALLVMRHLRLGLAPSWEAQLAKFPFLGLSGTSKATVKNLVITVRFSVRNCTGLVLQDVEVGIPDLDIELTCESALSQICVSVLLEIFKDMLKDHIQKQLHKQLLHLLQSEFSKWNSSVWRFLVLVVPDRLICRALKWFGSIIPPEGLPI